MDNIVYLTNIPINYYSYYQWFLLGLYEQKNSNQIQIKFKLPIYQYVFYFLLNNFLKRAVLSKSSKIFFFKNETYLLEGYLRNGKKIVKFCYDIADSPYSFHDEKLATDIIYFKAQCPSVLNENGFKLAPDAVVKYTDVVLKNTHKIYPSMLGPRSLGLSISEKHLKQNYSAIIQYRKEKKSGFIMCYFGDAKGPTPDTINKLNLNDEGSLLGFFGEKVNHPNEKRYKVYSIIKRIFSNYDARVINKNGTGDIEIDDPIPYSVFNKHVSKFYFNMNVSGYRLSIPNRFIESFMVGTAIVTDKLSVRWFKSFDKEVYETSEMGYLQNDMVNWNKIEHELSNLPQISSNIVIAAFENKWSPYCFGQYIISVLEDNHKMDL